MFLAALTIEYRTIYYKDTSQEREYKIFMILVTGRYKYTVMNLLRSYNICYVHLTSLIKDILII